MTRSPACAGELLPASILQILPTPLAHLEDHEHELKSNRIVLCSSIYSIKFHDQMAVHSMIQDSQLFAVASILLDPVDHGMKDPSLRGGSKLRRMLHSAW
jgi:hypothetical protein